MGWLRPAGRARRRRQRARAEWAGKAGLRPPQAALTRERKVLTNCYQLPNYSRTAVTRGHDLAGAAPSRVGVSLAAQALPYPVGQGSA